MRALLDQGLPASAAAVLCAIGWDVIHVRDFGMSSAADPEILRRARDDGRIVVTLDRDFPQLLAITNAARPSVILLRRQNLRSDPLVELLQAVWASAASELTIGCIVTVGHKTQRIRMLPIGA
jgi:predicted nuclease of predicted toxin-antitoxin system